MYSLRLTCKPDDIDLLSGELWEAGTIGIRELNERERVVLVAGFETNEWRAELVRRFAAYAPQWYAEEAVDWEAVSRAAWPEREVGEQLFLAPPWSDATAPNGRKRIIINPGLACGTGEHPCTQLALMAIEKLVTSGCAVVDVGTGSGILAIAALRLGASRAVGVDVDEAALQAARENFRLNGMHGELICGSAEALASGCADVVVANISATVLVNVWDELLRVSRRPGRLILTGFPRSEADVLMELLPDAEMSQLASWSSVSAAIR
ncbi:MAG: 50S ribosomal protein L11 methyltransferase [Acidobacteriaceae bacterium]|nr:50S ribosomal protein L11 methyltransferase [Acidobacteriaceae bacterium]